MKELCFFLWIVLRIAKREIKIKFEKIATLQAGGKGAAVSPAVPWTDGHSPVWAALRCVPSSMLFHVEAFFCPWCTCVVCRVCATGKYGKTFPVDVVRNHGIPSADFSVNSFCRPCCAAVHVCVPRENLERHFAVDVVRNHRVNHRINHGVPLQAHLAIGNLVEPSLFGESFELSPVVVLLSLTFWGSLWVRANSCCCCACCMC